AARRNGTLRDAPPGRKSLTVRPKGKPSPVREPGRKPLNNRLVINIVSHVPSGYIAYKNCKQKEEIHRQNG
ncbi:hypothetical protein, partial [Barnesiella intestinihominis]|uniref:hypothetical protein n=1 Tax=Barnesiella intestinihominis TaxID=487174 RepID=UPI003AB2638F